VRCLRPCVRCVLSASCAAAVARLLAILSFLSVIVEVLKYCWAYLKSKLSPANSAKIRARTPGVLAYAAAPTPGAAPAAGAGSNFKKFDPPAIGMPQTTNPTTPVPDVAVEEGVGREREVNGFVVAIRWSNSGQLHLHGNALSPGLQELRKQQGDGVS
jgi:hypothetical protein